MGPSKPLPLRVGQYLAAVAGVGGLVGLVLAPLDLHIYSVGASIVGGREFLAKLGVPYAGATGSVGLAAFALLRDFAWARAAMLWTWPIMAVLAGWDGYLGAGTVVGGAVQGIPVLLSGAIAALYLYRNRAAATYFDTLRSRAAA